MKPEGIGSNPVRAFSLPVADSVASVRPCQAFSITMVCASGSPCLWPYSRTSLIAPSLASEPELPKNTSCIPDSSQMRSASCSCSVTR